MAPFPYGDGRTGKKMTIRLESRGVSEDKTGTIKLKSQVQPEGIWILLEVTNSLQGAMVPDYFVS